MAVVAVLGGGLLWWVASGVEGESRRPVAAPGPESPGQFGGVPQGHVYTGVSEEPDTLNPFVANGAAALGWVLRYTHEGLLGWDSMTGDLAPGLASRWSLSEDGRVVTFELREGVRFANGEPVTRDDVMFSWHVASVPGVVLGRIAVAFDNVAEVEAPAESPGVVVVRLSQPAHSAVAEIGTNWFVVHRKSFLEAVGGGDAVALEDSDFVQRLSRYRMPGVGSGPYQLEVGNWRPQQDVLLTRNPHSWHRVARPGTWNFAGIRIRMIDGAATTIALRQRELDILPVRDREADVPEHCRLVEYDHPLLGSYHIIWNTRVAPLDDVRVRRALTLLMPRKQMLDVAFGGRGTVSSGPFLPDHPATLPPLEADREQALRLLKEAGYGRGEPLRLRFLVATGNTELRRLAEMAADALRTAGVELDMQWLEFANVLARMNSRTFDGVLSLKQHSSRLQDPYLDFHSSEAGPNGANASGAALPALDAALADAREASDAVRLKGWRRTAQILQEQQPVTWLVRPRFAVMLSKSIEGAKPGPMGLMPERFWVPTELQRK